MSIKIIFELKNTLGGHISQRVPRNSDSVENEFSKSLWSSNSTEEKYWLILPKYLCIIFQFSLIGYSFLIIYSSFSLFNIIILEKDIET